MTLVLSLGSLHHEFEPASPFDANLTLQPSHSLHTCLELLHSAVCPEEPSQTPFSNISDQSRCEDALTVSHMVTDEGLCLLVSGDVNPAENVLDMSGFERCASLSVYVLPKASCGRILFYFVPVSTSAAGNSLTDNRSVYSR